MKRSPILAALAALVLVPSAAPAEETPYWFAGEDATVYPLVARDFQETWLSDRLSIGLGFSFATLTDAKRPKDAPGEATFVGFVWKLEDTRQAGFVPELRYWAATYLRVTLTTDRVAGRTRNYNQMKHSDGVAELWGPELLLEGVYPLCDDTVFLHAGVGLSYEFGDFSEVTWWNLGYASEAAWRDHGSPTVKTAQDHYREIHVDDAVGWTLAAGCSWRPTPRLELDLSLRHTWIEPDCEFGYNYGSRKGGFKKQLDGEFTLDHLAVALTCSYVF